MKIFKQENNWNTEGKETRRTHAVFLACGAGFVGNMTLQVLSQPGKVGTERDTRMCISHQGNCAGLVKKTRKAVLMFFVTKRKCSRLRWGAGTLSERVQWFSLESCHLSVTQWNAIYQWLSEPARGVLLHPVMGVGAAHQDLHIKTHFIVPGCPVHTKVMVCTARVALSDLNCVSFDSWILSGVQGLGKEVLLKKVLVRMKAWWFLKLLNLNCYFLNVFMDMNS